MAHAHYSSLGQCVCGSSESVNELPTDPNAECRRPGNDPSCPTCVYACVHHGQPCPPLPGAANATVVVPPAPPTVQAARTCDFDREIVELESAASGLQSRAEGLRRLEGIDLPEFPPIDYCVRSTPTTVTVTIRDGSATSQQVLDASRWAGAAVTALGRLGVSSPWATGARALNAVLGGVRDGIVAQRTSSNQRTDPVFEFMRDTRVAAQGVDEVRRRMLCTVRTGVPELYRAEAELRQRAAALSQRIQAHPGCASLGAGLLRTIQAKLLGARRAVAWHAEGIMRPPGQERTGWALRRNWLDRRIGANGEPLVFAGLTCP